MLDTIHILLEILWFFIFCMFFSLVVGIIQINQKRLKSKKNIEIVIVQMILFTINVLVVGLLAEREHKNYMIVINSFTMMFVIYFTSKINIIGITGSIGSGKSTLVKHFVEKFKMDVIDCDQISRDIYIKDRPAYKHILKAFGTSILDPSHEIDRKKLGFIVFNDKAKLKKLNSITHYYIFKEILAQIYRIFVVKKETIAMLDAPLLLESKWFLKLLCFPITVVYLTDQEKQIARVLERDPHLTREDVQKRLNSQMSMKEKIKQSDIQVCNDTSAENMIRNFNKELPRYLFT